jgi:surface polysaccharide O-acyltransferase-like enzyme
MAEATLNKLGPVVLHDARAKKVYATIRADAILTGSYVASNHIDVQRHSDVALLFKITWGSLTSMEYYIEQSLDGSVWYREGEEEPATATITDSAPYHTVALSANLNYYLLFPVSGRYLRVRAKGTGTLTLCSLEVIAVGVN